ncbi:major capsid protein [Roseateles sp. BYS78W]|uniref:Major capsid protein n=1 Tax=Pelomonas candidula TaxID=3299025 RepID=A0ABW7H5N9_9BURK
MKLNRNALRAIATAGIAMLAGSAHAAAGDPDLSSVTAAGATVATVGAAVFTVMVGIKVIKWVRRAL